MVKTTPFHPRLAELNTTQLWAHWAGYLSATQYDIAAKHEYFGVRQAVGLLRRIPAVQVRDLRSRRRALPRRRARPRHPHLPARPRAVHDLVRRPTGYVLEDGVVFRHSANDFLLTAAEPNLSFLQNQIGSLDVVGRRRVRPTTQCSRCKGHGRARSSPTSPPSVTELGYFAHAQSKIAGSEVTVSRTGFTGDLGFEIRVPADRRAPGPRRRDREPASRTASARSATRRSTCCASRPACR